jgi:hypothetical protein
MAQSSGGTDVDGLVNTGGFDTRRNAQDEANERVEE